jgi:large subunit ribosomal protein L30
VAAKRGTRATGQGGALRVKWVHSEIGHNAAARGTIRALGLHRLQQAVEIADTPVNRGMIRRVAFLLEVEESDGGGSAAKTEEGHEGS